MNISVIILAAGQGVRMQSNKPKVLHAIGGKSILDHLISTVRQINPKQIMVVHGHLGEQLKTAFKNSNPPLTWVEQGQQLGTGHAVLQTLPFIDPVDVDQVLILYGDTPLIDIKTIQTLISITKKTELGFITAILQDATGFGRIIRDAKNQVIHVVEEKEATEQEKKIKEMNAGFFLVPKDFLEKSFSKVTKKQNQKQAEIYLTDIISMAVSEGIPIKTVSPMHLYEIMGVNTKNQLAELERIYQQQQAHQLMQVGVTLLDPNRLDVRGEVQTGKDVIIDVNVILEGKIVLGNNVNIGPNVYLKDVTIQDNVKILANSFIEQAVIGTESVIGPFSRIRPETKIASHAHIGNFVEIKNSVIGEGSKIGHLSYVGDATIGQKVNIGAGTITCNYDGVNKHKTIIGDHTFVGSNTQIVAPITIGEGATIGAGTTVLRDVPAYTLIHNQIQHRRVENWVKTNSKDNLKDPE